MSTSNSYNFSVNSNDIVREAMLNIGKLGEAENPTSQEYSDCLRKLNMLAKQWMAKQDFAPGLKMWKRKHADLLLSSSKFAYQLGPTGDNWAISVATSNQFPSWQTQTTASAVMGATSITVATPANFTIGDFLVIQLTAGDIYSTVVSNVVGSVVSFISGSLPSGVAIGNYVFNYTVKGQRPEVIETCVLRDNTGADVPILIITLQNYAILS